MSYLENAHRRYFFKQALLSIEELEDSVKPERNFIIEKTKQIKFPFTL